MSDDEQQQIEESLTTVASNDPCAAISILYHAYGERLKNLIALRLDRRLAGRIDPEDILQDAFIDIINNLPLCLQEARMPLYLRIRGIVLQRIIITRRRHINAFKRDARREFDIVVASKSNSNESANTIAQVLLSDDTSIPDRMIRAEQHAQLATGLARLESIDREIILLRFYENLTNLEVALILDLEPSAASKRFWRAIDRLTETCDRSPTGTPCCWPKGVADKNDPVIAFSRRFFLF